MWVLEGEKLTGPGLGDQGITLKQVSEGQWAVEAKTSFPIFKNDNAVNAFFDKDIPVTASENNSLTLHFPADCALIVELNPLIPLFPASNKWVKWSDSSAGDISFKITHTWPDPFDLTIPSEKELLQAAIEKIESLSPEKQWSALPDFVTGIFDRTLLDVGGKRPKVSDLKVSLGKPTWDQDSFKFENATAELTLGEKLLSLTAETVVLDLRTKQLASGNEELRCRLKEMKTLHLGSYLSVEINAGSVIKLTPAASRAKLSWENDGSKPIMSIYMPGIEGEEPKGKEGRFILDCNSPGTPNETFEIGPNGLTASAVCRPMTLPLKGGDGELKVQVQEGSLKFVEGRYTASISARASLPFLEGANGLLQVMASSVPGENPFLATWQMQMAEVWQDPTGYLQIENPKASVTIKYTNGKWDLDGAVGGRLRVLNGAKLLGDAGVWLEDFLEDFNLEFDGLKLSQLTTLSSSDSKGDSKSKPASITLKPIGLPDELRLWKLFRFKLSSYQLFSDGSFGFGGLIGFEQGGVRFSGTLPRLKVNCKGGLKISRFEDEALSIEGQLTTPGGVSARLSLIQVEDELVSELQGQGSLVMPGFPAIGVNCSIGRRPDDQPVLMLYVEGDFPITLYPGIIMRKTGVGFGVNKVLKGTNGVHPEELVPTLISNPAGLPNPALPDGWEVSTEDDIDVSFAAQTYLAPTPRGNGPFPYIGRATMFVRPTNGFVILLASNLWVFTSLEDAGTEAFQRKPAMKGVAALFPRHGYFELMVRTERSPRMTKPVQIVQKAFEIGSGEFYMKASRDVFVYRAGPMNVEASLAGVNFKGSLLYAVHVSGDQAIALNQFSLAAHTNKSCGASLRFGPLRVSAGFNLSFDLQLEALAAGIVHKSHGPILYARANVMVAFAIAAWVKLVFSLTIKLWRFKKSIRWSKSFSTTLRLSAQIDLEVAVSANSALYGRTQVKMHLFGYQFKPVLEIGNRNAGGLTTARHITNQIVYPKSLPAYH
ncbi:hypothetical protein [Thalassotalea atypica]|uniref:hypothetical protein n=1 Tax=Thalassotalea atypica TaxID=2054316 RepID=UPI002572E06F|nr:hypothetical protein [Thalassotalea atypica]